MAYNPKEPRMSQREKELTKASDAGQEAAYARRNKPVIEDKHLSQAWDNGYRIAGEYMGRVFKYAD